MHFPSTISPVKLGFEVDIQNNKAGPAPKCSGDLPECLQENPQKSRDGFSGILKNKPPFWIFMEIIIALKLLGLEK